MRLRRGRPFVRGGGPPLPRATTLFSFNIRPWGLHWTSGRCDKVPRLKGGLEQRKCVLTLPEIGRTPAVLDQRPHSSRPCHDSRVAMTPFPNKVILRYWDFGIFVGRTVQPYGEGRGPMSAPILSACRWKPRDYGGWVKELVLNTLWYTDGEPMLPVGLGKTGTLTPARCSSDATGSWVISLVRRRKDRLLTGVRTVWGPPR